MKSLTFTAALLLTCQLIIATTAPAAEKLPGELLVVRAQPAVFTILVFGDFNVSYPKHVTIVRSSSASTSQSKAIFDESRTLLEAEFARDQRDGIIPKGKTRSEYYWERIAVNPQRYLVASKELAHQTYRNLHYGGGTGFAISREGVLLTNAHVVRDPPLAIPTLSQPFRDLVDNLARELGSQPSDATSRKLGEDMFLWFAGHSRGSGQFKQAEVVLKFDAVESLDQWRKKHPGKTLLQAMGEYFDTRRPLTVPARVLVAGEPMPGKDVAVLKIDDQNVLDRLICLSLGDSDRVLPNTPIQAMGFPGSAYNPTYLSPESEFRVSNQPGTIGQTKPMKFGWNAFEMSAQIHHGDSGGPVIDNQADVIGLNVGAANAKVARITLAVPINVAKEFLQKAQIKPDPGPLTKLWVDGLKSFANGRYGDASQVFMNVLQRQTVTQGRTAYDRQFANQYVSDMWQRSKSMAAR